MVMLLISGVISAVLLDTDYGRIDVKQVTIRESYAELSGLLYVPKSADINKPSSGVVLAHGISSSKEMMSSIGLELARNGFVALCVDLFGHGRSEGSLMDGQVEPSLGVYRAIQYLKKQAFVNSSSIGLIGHSLGAGAVRAAAFEDREIRALVLIAGGIHSMTQEEQVGTLNSTYPKNVLVIVGKYDVLFDVTKLANEELSGFFGSEGAVSENVLYGSFSEGTARKFVVPLTTHLFEPLDEDVIFESTIWMENALSENKGVIQNIEYGFAYSLRELSIAIALVGLIGIIILSIKNLARVFGVKHENGQKSPDKPYFFRDLRLYLVWGILNVMLFIPMFGVGALIAFPPLVFGASIGWWMLVSGLAGLVILSKFLNKISGKKISIKKGIREILNKRVVILVVIVFFILFSITFIFDLFIQFDFRIITPIFRDFNSFRRVLVFFLFIAFFLPYFIAEGFFMHQLPSYNLRKQNFLSVIKNYSVTLIAKLAPFAGLIFVQYISKIVFGVWLFPGFVGFLLEIFWLITPIFAIALTFSWWFYKETGNSIPGAVLNSLVVSWITATAFPF
jgi:dienelactone hydrolase